MGEDIWGRPIMILGFILVIGGIQFITTGIIAEIIVRTYFESQNKKTYTVKSVFVGEQVAVGSVQSAEHSGQSVVDRLHTTSAKNAE